MSTPRIEELLRISLLGQELINTQFHLFSRRSSSARKVVDCRILCANNVLLTENTTFFVDLLNGDADPAESDPSMRNVAENDNILSGIPIDEYGYESDSDLDDDDDDKEEDPETAPVSAESGTVSLKKNSESSADASESSDSDTFLSDSGDDPESAAGLDKGKSADAGTEPTSATIRAASTTWSSVTRFHTRHILVKDTAFQTWYALLNYLYTGKVVFLPPRSSSSRSQASSTSTAEEPKCSAKSMYRLACKVGIDALRDLAFASIRSSITEQNVLAELAHKLLSRHPPILEMQLDILFKHIASPLIVTGLPSLVQRIANKELPHGADVINGLHTRILMAHYPHYSLAPRSAENSEEEEEDPAVGPPPSPRPPSNPVPEPAAAVPAIFTLGGPPQTKATNSFFMPTFPPAPAAPKPSFSPFAPRGDAPPECHPSWPATRSSWNWSLSATNSDAPLATDVPSSLPSPPVPVPVPRPPTKGNGGQKKKVVPKAVAKT